MVVGTGLPLECDPRYKQKLYFCSDVLKCPEGWFPMCQTDFAACLPNVNSAHCVCAQLVNHVPEVEHLETISLE